MQKRDVGGYFGNGKGKGNKNQKSKADPNEDHHSDYLSQIYDLRQKRKESDSYNKDETVMTITKVSNRLQYQPGPQHHSDAYHRTREHKKMQEEY